MMIRTRTRAKKSITVREVAKHAGVSLRTVTNVMNNWPYVTEQTRQKVQLSIDTLGYRPSQLASSLATGRTSTIGVVLPDITNPFFGQVVRGCEDALYTAGYSIFLCNTNEDLVKQSSYFDMLVDRGVDGLLIFGARSNSDAQATVVHGDIPVVTEDSPVQSQNTTALDIDNVGGAQLAVAHLISRGHTVIGHLGGPSKRLAAIRRLDGYRQALEQAGIAYDESLVLRCSPNIRGGLEAALTLLRDKKPTALFCYNDMMAVGVLVACRQLGLKIPRDVALVGFDDVAMASLVEPALTTVRVDQYELGRQASQLLLERLSGQANPRDFVTFPVELVVRDSCGSKRTTRKPPSVMLEHLLRSESPDSPAYITQAQAARDEALSLTAT
jgi:LacI family transcriptional regulator